ncbi:MAG TPA: hypothetical protein PKX17_03130 [Candidatus Methanomethylicus sp.]|nr:hypothetical protein [Candidatus Methanomethylicus sp.]
MVTPLIDPKTSLMLRMAFKKVMHRAPLSASMVISMAILTYALMFSETFGNILALWAILLVTILLSLTTSFALEYDTEDELESLVCIGVSPSDIMKIGISRVLTMALMGYFIGFLVALAAPLGAVTNVKLFYTFLICIMFGGLSPLYSAVKSLRVSLLGRQAFVPLSEKEIPSIIYPSEAGELKAFIEDVLTDSTELVLVSASIEADQEPAIVLECRYIGVSGRESAAFISSTGLNPYEVFRKDETLPLVAARLRVRDGKSALLNCWEKKGGRDMENTYIALSFANLVRQLVIEYKVYRGRRRAGAEAIGR